MISERCRILSFFYTLLSDGRSTIRRIINMRPCASETGGDALLPTGRVLKPGGEVVNGPYVEAKEVIGGFSVVEAEHYEAAVEIAKGCPIAKIGGAIEIREFAGYN